MSDTSEPVIETPVVEAPAAPEAVVETPAVETPAPDAPVADAPVVEGAPAEPVVETPAAIEDPFEAYGGKEAIDAAHRMYQAAQSDEGVVQLFLEAGQSLGLGLKELQALFGVDLGEPAPDPDAPDPDEPITYAQFQEIERRRAEEAKAAEAERTRATAKEVVQKSITELGLDPASPTTQIVLQMADQHVKGNYTPEAISAAIRQGHADYQALVEKEAQAYLTKKQAQAAAVPQAPAGAAAPVEPPAPEPQDTAEAARRVREMLGLRR